MMNGNCKVKNSKYSTFIIYTIIYAGYWKLLFSEISIMFTILQFVAIVCAVILTIRDRYFWSHKKPLTHFMWIILFLLWRIALGMLSDSAASYQRVEEAAMTVAFAFILLFAANKIDIEREPYIFDTVIVLNLIAVVLYLIVYGTMIMRGLAEGLRLGDVNGSSIWTARFCGDAIICCAYKYMKKNRSIYIITGLFFFMVAVLTASKGPLLAILVVLSMYYFHNENNTTKKMKVGFILFVGAIGILIAFQFITNEVILYRFSFKTAVQNAPGYRVDRYIYTIKNILSAPFRGNGIGQWGHAYWQQYKVNLDYIDYADYPHNIILEICYEMGLIAVLLFLLPVVKCIKEVKKLENGYIVASLIIINVFYAFTSGSVVDGNRGIYYWIAFCCGIICRNYSKKDRHEISG